MINIFALTSTYYFQLCSSCAFYCSSMLQSSIFFSFILVISFPCHYCKNIIISYLMILSKKFKIRYKDFKKTHDLQRKRYKILMFKETRYLLLSPYNRRLKHDDFQWTMPIF